jgi:hypothetical protein
MSEWYPMAEFPHDGSLVVLLSSDGRLDVGFWKGDKFSTYLGLGSYLGWKPLDDRGKMVDKPAPKPECRTCPLSTPLNSLRCLCHSVRLTVDGSSTMDIDWYCELHPGYPEWSEHEYRRRLEGQP